MANSSTGRNKGSGFERKICKTLSTWVTDNKDEYVFKRNGGSGGALSDKSGFGNAGDITTFKTAGVLFIETYSVECKFYENVTRSFMTWLQEGTGIIQKFIDQAKDDAKRYKKRFILIFKSNNIPEMVVSDDPKFSKLDYAVIAPRHNKQKLYIVPLESLTKTNYKEFMGVSNGG